MARIKKIKAYSIVESAIAMSVIAACLGIGSMVFANVLQSSKNYGDVYLENEMDSILVSTIDKELFINENIDTRYGKIQKSVEQNENNGLITLKVTGESNSGKKIEKSILLFKAN